MGNQVEADKARLELSGTAPKSIDSLLFRLVISDAGIDGNRAQLTLQAAGRQCSPMRASMTISDARRMLRILDEAGLLHPDFDRLRRRKFNDFIERAPKKRRRLD